MSLKPEPMEPVPEETARIARAAFPNGNLCLRLRETLGAIYTDQLFADLFPRRGQPAEAPWRLALVTVLQFVEGLSDRQAADAVRARIDWKYMLSLPLSDPGFDDSVLSEFRSRLVAGGAELRLLEVLLEQCQARGWLKARGRKPHRFHPCAGRRPRPQPTRDGGRDRAPRTQCPSRSRSSLVAGPDHARLV